jgi:hypothetical protein
VNRVFTSRGLQKALLIALLLTCFVGLQTVSATHEHKDADHCCPICNAGHLPVGPAVAMVQFAPPAEVNWQGVREPDCRPIEHFTTLRSSRGPPAPSFSI